MKKNHNTRREFLKVTSLGVVEIKMPSGAFTETKPVTFVHICDTQLGMGG